MIGYKGTYNGKCRDITYEVGKTYIFKGHLELCSRGFHYCKNPDDVFNYYQYNKDFVLLEIEILGEVIDDGNKSVTDKFKVLREIPESEYNNIFKICKFDKEGKFTTESRLLGEFLSLFEYDTKKRLIYFLNSTDFWERNSYDENDNLVYKLTSNGERSKWNYENNKLTYHEISNGYWQRYTYDKNGNKIYYETSEGYWEKYQYDENNNRISEKNSYGDAFKWEYDKNNNQIYFANSYGYWEKSIYDKNNNLIHQENSNGFWIDFEYNDKNDKISEIRTDGCQQKWEYDYETETIIYNNSDIIWSKTVKGNIIEKQDAVCSMSHYKIIIEGEKE